MAAGRQSATKPPSLSEVVRGPFSVSLPTTGYTDILMKQNSDRSLRPRLWIRLAISVALCSLIAATGAAQNSALAPEKRSQIESAISRFMASTHVPGVSVAVVQNGEYAWAQGYGFADLENNVPASEHTLYRLASISKPLTAVAALQLWERGRLDLDSPVQKYCPSFPQKPWPISTRQVLGHLGGIRHYKSGSQDDPEIGNTKHFDDPIAAGLNFFKDDSLVAQPGTSFHYSTQGYTLVGCVVEGASRSKYVEFVRQNVLNAAQMQQTQADDRFAIIPYRTRFYEKGEAGVRNADFLDSSYKIPGGGWLSSAEDMARFEVAVLNDKLIRRATRDLMWTPLKPSDGKPDAYALGWGWSEQKNGEVAGVGHTGGQQGTSTAIVLAPDLRDGVVVLANMEDVDAGELARELLNILAAASGKKP
jgi:serine beta-lactamase-like protein LACTB